MTIWLVEPPEMVVRPGTKLAKSPRVWALMRVRSAAVTAVTVWGTFCTVSERRVAVTTTSVTLEGSVGGDPWPASSAGAPAGAVTFRPASCVGVEIVWAAAWALQAKAAAPHKSASLYREPAMTSLLRRPDAGRNGGDRLSAPLYSAFAGRCG